MSKHKNFHSTKNIMKAIQHGRRNAIGPYYSWKPKRYEPVQDKKEAAQGATNTQSGKADKTVENPVKSASSVPESKEESQVLKGSEDSHKVQNMSNNERFNEILNSCKHPRLVFNALASFPKKESQA